MIGIPFSSNGIELNFTIWNLVCFGGYLHVLCLFMFMFFHDIISCCTKSVSLGKLPLMMSSTFLH